MSYRCKDCREHFSVRTGPVLERSHIPNEVEATVISGVSMRDLQESVMRRISAGNEIFTAAVATYKGLPNHEPVNHTVGEYVNGEAHTNGIESFWGLLKRTHTGTFHKISYKHLQRYVNEFVGRHNLRLLNTKSQMTQVVAAMVGRRLMYR